MSRVTGFVEGKRAVKRHESAGECEYQEIEDPETGRLLQLSTFGSAGRAGNGVTQTIQIDFERAQELVAILRSTFRLR
jgi:hypothetical protein